MPEPRKTLLTAGVPPLDKYWAIENSFAVKAQRELDKRDFAAHAREFQAGLYDDDDGGDEGDAPSKPYVVNGDGVATLYLSGPITKRPTSMSYFFGGTSSILLRRAVRQAAADPDVKAIALIVDSPGGQVTGTADLAADVAAAAEKKPVGAYAEDTCCSAAYWVASQADFLYCNLTGAVGSIGTLLVIEDTSSAYAKEGVKVHVVSTGPYKGAGADGAPITKAHLADFQREVDEINACFLQGVADGRENLNLEQVTALATGQSHIGQKAVDLGLCDAVTSLDEFLETMAMQAEAFAKSSDAPAASPDLPPGQDDGDSSPGASRNTLTEPGFSEAGSTSPSLTSPSIKETDIMADETLVQQQAPAPAPALAVPSAPSAQAAIGKDILAACQAAGITSAKSLTDRLDMARLGDRYAADVREDAKVQAIRAYGVEVGQQCASSCEHLPVETVASMRDGWKAQADKTFGFGENGKAPARASALAAPKVSVPAEADAEAQAGETQWSKLTAAQRAQGKDMGMKTPAQRESFAATVLGTIPAEETN